MPLSPDRTIEVIIFLVLLVWWLDISPDSGIQFLDYFAGRARLALVAEGAGYKVQAYDKAYGDALGKRKNKRSSMDLNSNAGMVIAISLILRSKLDQLVAAFGVVCSSFVPVNKGTSKRCYLCPLGDESSLAVRKGNKLMARSTILMHLVVAAGDVQSFDVDEKVPIFHVEADVAVVYFGHNREYTFCYARHFVLMLEDMMAQRPIEFT
ncbi:unnamed protein product, partial [Symbiodinium necroappetens]